MDEFTQFLPSVQDMATTDIPSGNWLLFFHNTWRRQVIARTVDVYIDTKLKENDPDQMVGHSLNGEAVQTKVKYRLEHRKMKLQEALEVVEAVEALKLLTPEQIHDQFWGEEAMKVAPDVAAEAAGDEEQQTAIEQNFTVLADEGINLDGTQYSKDEIVALDPSDQNTVTLVADGKIALKEADAPALPEQKQYKFLVDFGVEAEGGAKAGETIMLPGAGWTPEQVADAVAAGTIALVTDDAAAADTQEQQQETAPAETSQYEVISDNTLTVDGVEYTKGQKLDLTLEVATPLLQTNEIQVATPESVA